MTRRRVIARPQRRRFSDEVLAIYAAMRDLPCTCGKPDPFGLKDTECQGCKEWQRLQGQLWRVLPGHKPWHLPLLPRRDEPTPDGWALRDALEEALVDDRRRVPRASSSF